MDTAESETVISESKINTDDLPRLINNYLTYAVSYIKKLDYENALDALSHNDDLLNAAALQKAYVDPDYMIANSHNTALCYQR